MIALIQILQVASAAAWLALALFSLPRMVASWRSGANRLTAISARNGFLAWLMFGFCARWFVWPGSISTMGQPELICWAALYALSALCAVWFFAGALQNRGR